MAIESQWKALFYPKSLQSKFTTQMTHKEIKDRIAWIADTSSSDAWESKRMKIFGERIAKEIIDSTIDEAIKAIDSLGYTRYDNFDYIQITEAIERIKEKT